MSKQNKGEKEKKDFYYFIYREVIINKEKIVLERTEKYQFYTKIL